MPQLVHKLLIYNTYMHLFNPQVEFTPNSIHKFDTHIQVNVRGWKTISLRVGGTVEPPCVDMDVVSSQNCC